MVIEKRGSGQETKTASDIIIVDDKKKIKRGDE